MLLNQKETKADTSSDKKTIILAEEPQAEVCPILANPNGEPYETAWERMMQGLEKMNAHNNPPLDCLGRKRKDYIPAKDDVACDDRHPAPWEDQGDGKDAYGNAVTEEDMSMPVGELENEHRVVLFRDHMLEFPELNLKVFLVGPPGDCAGFPQLFARAGCMKAMDPQDADLVVFTGGPDVDPAYYGQKPIASYYGDDNRDDSDLEVYWQCYNEGIPMVGVCRGAQFGAVMGGFKLVQDIDNHQGDHPIWDVVQKRSIDRVSSVHHQAVIPGPGMDLIAYATMSTKKWLGPESCLEKNKLGLRYPNDCEAFFIRDNCFFGVQGHPEYRGYNAYAKWFLNNINELIVLNADVDFETNEKGELRRRLKKEFIKERDFYNKEKYEEFISTTAKKPKKETLSVPSNENIIVAAGE